jgi:hypothetical protein
VRGWDACVLLSAGLLLLGIRQLDELLADLKGGFSVVDDTTR